MSVTTRLVTGLFRSLDPQGVALRADGTKPIAKHVDADVAPPTWRFIERCPACNSARARSNRLRTRGYRVGKRFIPFPPGGLALAQCADCTLIYKTARPNIDWPTGDVDACESDFTDEIRELRRLSDDRALDVLEVGDGRALLAWLRYSPGGRCATLCANGSLVVHAEGESIGDPLDAEKIRWSEDPYDVALLLDALDRLTSPDRAFRNLKNLVRPGGYLLIASELVPGNSTRPPFSAQSIKTNLFWSRDALHSIAARFAFDLLIWREAPTPWPGRFRAILRNQP